jgi:hypothetical protein
MPVNGIWGTFYDVALFDHLLGFALYLVITHTSSNDKYLTTRMGMPVTSGSCFKKNMPGNRGIDTVGSYEWKNPSIASEVF